MNDQPVETEIKLRLPAGSRARLERHPAFQSASAAVASRADQRDEITTYFDTHDLALNEEKISLRVRASPDGKRVQTVKAAGDGDGAMMRRGEWEEPIESDTPDVRHLSKTPAGAALSRRDLTGLRPICATLINRTTWRLRLDEGTSIEAALDEGTIVAGINKAPVAELELELKSGAVGSLYRLALDLTTILPLSIETESKAARGFRLHTGGQPKAREAPRVRIASDTKAAVAFERIVGSILGHMLANVSAVDLAEPEAVHQLRTAIRRMRSALVLFAPHLHAETAARFNAELRRIGQLFGEARDWDVFALETLPGAAAEMPVADWTGLLRTAAEAKRAAAYDAVRWELRGPAFTRLVLGMAGWVEDGSRVPALLGDAGMARTIGDLKPALLHRMARKVAARGKALDSASPARLHALRKAVKKLRYGTEFLSGPHPDKAARTRIWACKDLAKRLGKVNDAAMTPLLAARLTEGAAPGLAPAVGLLAKWSRTSREKAIHRLPKAWHAYRSADGYR